MEGEGAKSARGRLGEQINFLAKCQKFAGGVGLETSADLLPPPGGRWAFDGEYIETLKDLFSNKTGVDELVALLDLCKEEYLTSKEEKDQAWIENFFEEPMLGELERGREIFEKSSETPISNFAKGLKNVLDQREARGSDRAIGRQISYAHLLTGIPLSEEVTFEALSRCYNDLYKSLGRIYADLQQILQQDDAEIILNFYNLIQSKVYDQLKLMQQKESQKGESSSYSEFEID